MDFEALGLNAKLLIAGFAGGVVHAFFFGDKEAWAAVSSVIGGVFTANYFGDLIAHQLNLPDTAGGFIVGLTAMAVCQGIIGAVSIWKLTRR